MPCMCVLVQVGAAASWCGAGSVRSIHMGSSKDGASLVQPSASSAKDLHGRHTLVRFSPLLFYSAPRPPVAAVAAAAAVVAVPESSSLTLPYSPHYPGLLLPQQCTVGGVVDLVRWCASAPCRAPVLSVQSVSASLPCTIPATDPGPDACTDTLGPRWYRRLTGGGEAALSC